MDIINERTVGMSFDEYKALRKKGKLDLKKHKKGEIEFVSKTFSNFKHKGVSAERVKNSKK